MTEDKWDEGSGKEDRFFSRKYENPDVFDYIDSKLGFNSSVGMSPKLAEAMQKSKVKLLDPKVMIAPPPCSPKLGMLRPQNFGMQPLSAT